MNFWKPTFKFITPLNLEDDGKLDLTLTTSKVSKSNFKITEGINLSIIGKKFKRKKYYERIWNLKWHRKIIDEHTLF